MGKYIKYYQLMHKFGKLTSCDAENPHPVDEKFIEELLEKIKDEKN